MFLLGFVLPGLRQGWHRWSDPRRRPRRLQEGPSQREHQRSLRPRLGLRLRTPARQGLRLQNGAGEAAAGVAQRRPDPVKVPERRRVRGRRHDDALSADDGVAAGGVRRVSGRLGRRAGLLDEAAECNAKVIMFQCQKVRKSQQTKKAEFIKWFTSHSSCNPVQYLLPSFLRSACVTPLDQRTTYSFT